MTMALRVDGSVAVGPIWGRGFSEEASAFRLVLAAADGTPSISATDRTQAALEALRSAVSEAWQAGWDGDAARPADANAFVYAIELLDALPVALPLPEIAVDVDGDIALEWDRGPKRLISLRVSRDGTLYYSGLVGASTFHGSEPLRQGLPRSVSAGIDRVLSDSPI